MATILDKDITRESTIKVEGREVMITLNRKQEVVLKLKGTRGKSLSIGIEDLWEQLSGVVKEEVKGVVNKRSKDEPLISLHDIRTYNSISDLDYTTKCKFESILKNLIENYPERYGRYCEE